ncbi:MAG TPA: FAA hydrolase family protein [Myxococcales bacterium]|nr:FAA hydrolase family protein [Myxococcales bacterium]HIK84819.1 FAA hydrolase family protein [Myxococcales bacterium]
MGFRLANTDGRAALVFGDNYYDLEKLSGGKIGSDPMEALAEVDTLGDLSAGLAEQTPTGRLEDVRLGSPSPRPRNCYGIGLNYRNHAEEGGMPIPDAPLVFTKFPSCIVGPDDDVEMRSDYVDYEGELVAVIGRGGKDIAVGDGWKHVAGLCVGQDISDRPAQFAAAPPQFNLGKSFDTYGPMGPILVSPDELPEGGAMELVTKVNDEVRQKDSTGDLIFDVPTLVSYLSHITTLNPGDVIFTGTPGGVGVFGGKLLKDGDVITTSIEGLGTVTNRCVRVADHPRADVVPLPIKNAMAGKSPG